MKKKYKLDELVNFFERYHLANRKDKRKMADEFGIGINAASRIAGFLGLSESRHIVDRGAISQKLAEGLSVKTIAEELGVSKEVVYKQINEAKK